MDGGDPCKGPSLGNTTSRHSGSCRIHNCRDRYEVQGGRSLWWGKAHAGSCLSCALCQPFKMNLVYR